MTRRARLPLLAALLGVVALTVVLLSGGSGYVVRGEFADASGLRPDYTVRLDGVTVGRVAAVTVTPHTMALVTLDLNSSAAPVGRDATLSIQPSNLLGEKFVALNPGNRANPARSGTLIPLSRTSTPTELDQVISTFDPQARQALAIFLEEEGDALLGRGQDLETTFQRMPGALDSLTTLVQQLGSDNRTLGTLLDQSNQIVGDAAAQRTSLGRLVNSANGAFSTFAAREHGLAQTIVAAPATLAQLRTTLVALREAAGPVGAAAAGLRTTAGPLTQTLDAVPGFSAAALPALQTVRQVAPSLTRLGTQATPVLDRAQGLGTALSTFSTSLGPVSGTLNTGIGDLLGLMEGWDRAIQDRDAAGHLFRPYAVTPPNTVIKGLLGTYINTGSLRRTTPGRSTASASPRTPTAAALTASAPTDAAPSGSQPSAPTSAAPSDPLGGLTKSLLGALLGSSSGTSTSQPAPGGGLPKAAGSLSQLLGYLLHR